MSLPAGLAHAHGELLTHHELQFDFPQYKPTPPPQWNASTGGSFSLPAPLLSVLGWTLFAAMIGFIVYFVVRAAVQNGWFRKKDASAQKPAAEPEWRPTTAAARNLLRDADALAALGKYGEAVHLILLRSIEHIDLQRPDVVRQALTSREIARLAQLPPAARSTFSGIAQVVERALFAEREISAAEFSQCREAYERFAFPDTWRQAA
jgi:hypothetical protein